MAPPVLRPENIIKRAEELVSVGNSQAALVSLYEFITSRRIRYADPALIEPIVYKFLELGVELKKGKLIKDGLHQYKKLVQGSQEGLYSVGAVARKFIDIVEKKLDEEQAREDSKSNDEEDDLEGGVTPENLLTSIYEADQSVGGFNDEAITSWLRFTWESYKSALDLLRNNSQLEITYSGVVNRTMQFCLKNNRKHEFKRLADMLRQHLDTANYQQSKHGTNIVDLSDDATLQRYLDQRFQLVNISVKLELWHDAYKAAEDVYHLSQLSKRSPKASTLAAYYTNLSKIFFYSGDQLLHTIAYNKFYKLYSSNPNASEEQFKNIASTIFLSALSIKLDDLPTVGYNRQLGSYRLVDLTDKTNRKEILESLRNDDLFNKVDDEIKQLYHLLEEDFSVENVQAELVNLLPILSAKSYFNRYAEQIRDVIVRKLIIALSVKYDTVEIDELYKMVQLPEPLSLSYWSIEKQLLNAAMDDYVSFTINHEAKTITFNKDPLEQFVETAAITEETETATETEGKTGAEEEEEEEVEAEEDDADIDAEEADNQAEPEVVVTRNSYIRNKLSKLSEVLHEAENYNEISYMEKVKMARENLILQTREAIEKAKEAAAYRARKAQEQKDRRLADYALQSEEDAKLTQQRLIEEKEAMDAKLAKEAHQRLVEKKKQNFQQLKKEMARKYILEANESGNVYVDPAEAEKLEFADLQKLINDQIVKSKADLEERMQYSLKKLDYTERAFRKAELPLLQKESDSMKEVDLAKYNVMKEKIIETAKTEFEAKLEDHKRLTAVYDDFLKLKERLYNANEEKIGDVRKAKQEAFEKAKAARIAEVRQQRYEEAVAKQKQEAADLARTERLKKQEEIARKQREVERTLEQKSAARTTCRIPTSAPLVSRNTANLDEIARKQREVEEALERRAASSTSTNGSSAPAHTSRAPVANKSQADLDAIARKQREVEAALEARLSGKSPAPAPTPAPAATNNEAPKKLNFAERLKLKRQQQAGK